jgi:hypothetical protein
MDIVPPAGAGSEAPSLFHISDEQGIEIFHPRESPFAEQPVVWAIEESRLGNYLLPRDCPRVTFYAGPNTTVEDRQRFLGTSPSVVAVENAWYDRITNSTLWKYRLPASHFDCIDECAGYYVSCLPAIPLSVTLISRLIPELLSRGGELRFLPSLWPLHDAVAASTLQFSMIRMRSAGPRHPRARGVYER